MVITINHVLHKSYVNQKSKLYTNGQWAEGKQYHLAFLCIKQKTEKFNRTERNELVRNLVMASKHKEKACCR